jgi:hypothetical protein
VRDAVGFDKVVDLATMLGVAIKKGRDTIGAVKNIAVDRRR